MVHFLIRKWYTFKLVYTLDTCFMLLQQASKSMSISLFYVPNMHVVIV